MTPLLRSLRFLGFALLTALATGVPHSSAADYELTDPALKLVTIESDPHESLLGLAVDGTGRIFAGSREGLFVYEPDPHGLYLPRRELYRFPANTWIYDIAVRGHDLYVLTVAALYVFRDGVVAREGLKPERLLWGMPVAHVHQGLHGMTFGPDGDLYISQGDQLWYYGDFRRRPDHWGHWTIYHGPENTPTPYPGSGGVLRLSPDGRKLSIIANGTRNDCGLAFDEQWNLFGSDNDHESMPNDFVPGRLLHLTPHAYFNWPRGWMQEKQPWRSDLLETMTPDLGRYVPVGMTYYGDSLLPEKYRNALFVPEWGSRKIAFYPLHAEGDSFKTTEQLLLQGRNDARPVSVTTGRGGRLFAAICFMAHNEESPMYRSDLVMITRADDSPEAPFTPIDEVSATTEKLFGELAAPDWSRRFRAHLELTRRGADAAPTRGGKTQRGRSKKPGTGPARLAGSERGHRSHPRKADRAHHFRRSGTAFARGASPRPLRRRRAIPRHLHESPVRSRSASSPRRAHRAFRSNRRSALCRSGQSSRRRGKLSPPNRGLPARPPGDRRAIANAL